MAMALRRAGRDDFVVLERAASVGGTWRDNTYPGVACDVPSHLYGFAEHPNPDWSGTYARGDEIRAYLERRRRDASASRPTCGSATAMLAATWDAGRRGLAHRDGEPAPSIARRARARVRAAHRAVDPRHRRASRPSPGRSSTPSRWDHAADLAGARVAVVGTGASAVQLVPELARTAPHVTLFQRTPAWIVPRGGDAVLRRRARAVRGASRRARAAARDLYAEGEARFASRSGDAAASREAQADGARPPRRAGVATRRCAPRSRPDYAFGCKRVLLSDDFYPALASGAVTLEASALAAVEGSTLVAASGARHEVDALVLATGFASTRQPYAELVRGETRHARRALVGRA